MGRATAYGRAESDESYGERQLANFRTLLAIPEFDEMTVEQRRKCCEDLARGFQPTVPRSGLPGDPFPVIGWLLLAAGVAISISSFFLDTSTAVHQTFLTLVKFLDQIVETGMSPPP